MEKFYLQVKVWVNEITEEGAEMKRLGIDKNTENLTIDDAIIEIFDIAYMFPCTMKEDKDSCFIRFKSGDEMIIASTFKSFSKEFFSCIEKSNK